MKHANISVFVPHNGCPHQCSFCNQKEITGQVFQPTADDVRAAINTALASLGDRAKDAELAFFGGSFTAIDRSYMTELLSAAYPFVRDGSIYGIRISTRPDAIDCERLNILKSFGVTAIELGAQSMDDEVLAANRRGHTSEDVSIASELICSYGFSLGLQMMTGLYKSSDEKDIRTAEKLAALRPDTMRVYPTVVMKGTQLAELFVSGEYKAPDTQQAVRLCTRILRFFEEQGIPVIRLGLHDSPSLRESMIGGAYHPAFRELVESGIMLENALAALEKNGTKSGEVTFLVSEQSVSRFTGQKRSNIIALSERGIKAAVKTDTSLGKYDVEICCRRRKMKKKDKR